MFDPAPSTQPYPPRFRWLKRLGGFTLLMIVALIALRLWWGHRANARLEAAVDAIAATGDPIRFEDMVIEPVPDQDNKAYHFRLAQANWPTVPGQGVVITETDWYDQEGEPNRPPDPIADNAAYLQQVKDDVLPHLRRLEQARGCDWSIPLQSPAIDILLPYLGELRSLAHLIEDAVQRAHAVGDKQRIMEWIRLTMALSEAANVDPPMLISHLVRVSIQAAACKMIEETTPTLTLAQGDRQHPARSEVEALLVRLLDEAGSHHSFAQGFVGERWMQYDTTMAVIEGRMSSRGFGFHLAMARSRPILINDVHFMVV